VADVQNVAAFRYMAWYSIVPPKEPIEPNMDKGIVADTNPIDAVPPVAGTTIKRTMEPPMHRSPSPNVVPAPPDCGVVPCRENVGVPVGSPLAARVNESAETLGTPNAASRPPPPPIELEQP